ncbi:putative RNA-directed DNA polymerase from transposon X-element [Hypsizygus marmoreus]|uniref:RNA-directed DNA polymerase from transposon X-element n=1 Tax=Hypsizygus marmoreus TaxID=39966 RepID=A0A369JEK0_HYPMA|nr:putative RNA-directed DNA polymerase from transposon X-element [Hypsizygus marmoreus]
MAKVLTAIIAEDTTWIVERHYLLPATHFGGRPGHTTTDAVYLLVHLIKDAWRRGKVISVLFLDIEGAFPNAVTDRVIHNLRKRGIPTAYVEFIRRLLEGRMTRLKFDDFLSELIKISNGIGQGDPFSMMIYILYNAELLEIVRHLQESAVGYVDDGMAVAEGKDFNETTEALHDIMEREEGGFKWSADHNSNFELSKLAIVHFTQKRVQNPQTKKSELLPRPPLILRGITVKEVTSYKYLGIHVDNELRAAAILYHSDRLQPARTLRYHLGLLTKHTSYEAEAVSSILAAWLLQNERDVMVQQVISYMDSQAFINAISAQTAKSGQYLMDEYLELTESMGSGCVVASPAPSKFELRWISGHSGVDGNERVDEEAKRAAQGESSHPNALPPILRKPLPSSTTAEKQAFMKQLQLRWTADWKKSPRHATFSKIDPNFPFNKFRKLRDKLTCHQASQLMQLCTGHIPLNMYLHRIGKARLPRCKMCYACSGQTIPETVKHYLFKCQAYSKERHQMSTALRWRSRDMRFILGSEKGMTQLAKFIARTSRLRHIPGDGSHTN